MPNTHSSTSGVPPMTDFTKIHEIIRDHLSRGNYFAVLAILALNVVHEDPAFWQTCTYHDGIVMSVIASCLWNCGISAQPLQETTARGKEDTSNLRENPLSANELYIMLRRICGEDALLCRCVEQLESHNLPRSESITTNGVEESAPSSGTQLDLGELYTLLRERCCNLDGIRNQTREAVTPSCMSSETLKRAREVDGSEECLAVSGMKSIGVAAGLKGCQSPENVNEGACSDALEVLARLPALPGTTHSATSFDALANQMTAGDGDVVGQGFTDRMFAQSFSRRTPVSNRDASVKERRPVQRRHKFSPEEDEAIMRGVARFSQGPGRFESIFSAYREVWHPARTATQLRDHWRGTLRQRVVLQQEGYRGKDSIATRGGNNEMI